MPRLTVQPLFAGEGVRLRRVGCDGLDAPRARDEGGDAARIILVLHGRFMFRDAAGSGVASPLAALFLPDDHTYRIRHVDGGDVCVAIDGAFCRTLVDGGPVFRRVAARADLRVRDLVARLARREPVTPLEVEERLADALQPAPHWPVSARASDRAVADAIVHAIERDPDARLSLAVLARAAGVSIFQACRTFKRVTGSSIHRHHQEVRLRHALAWLVDTDRPIARIAVDTGFANQGHFTNLFRRRFGTTPGRARANGMGLLAHALRGADRWSG